MTCLLSFPYTTQTRAALPCLHNGLTKELYHSLKNDYTLADHSLFIESWYQPVRYLFGQERKKKFQNFY
jgi:hypothetical protein